MATAFAFRPFAKGGSTVFANVEGGAWDPRSHAVVVGRYVDVVTAGALPVVVLSKRTCSFCLYLLYTEYRLT